MIPKFIKTNYHPKLIHTYFSKEINYFLQLKNNFKLTA